MRAAEGDAAILGVVVVAAGSSRRMGGVDKQLALLRGEPVLARSLRAFQASPLVGAVGLVLSETNMEQGRALVEACGFTKVRAVTPGGARRQDSVRLGLQALKAAAGEFEFLAVHDGARPFVDEALIARGLAAARAVGAAVAALPVKDTIKSVDSNRLVTGTPDRSTLWTVQTPQVFRASVLEAAHSTVMDDVTDDASMVERAGGLVAVFEGHAENLKITTPEDLLLAEMIASRRSDDVTVAHAGAAGDTRWGTGFDGHRLTPGGPLRLGGVDVPFDMRLAGHSDGDVLLHAVASALLGAAGLGDLGRHFPSSDPAYAGAESRIFVQRASEMARERGWMVEHLDATIIAQRPKLAAHLVQMAGNIASAAGVPQSSVNVKVTSTDGVGAIGEGQGIAAQAIATIRRRTQTP